MNLLSSVDLSKNDINDIFKLADSLADGSQELALKEHAAVAIFFEEPSTRTRVSFEVATAQLGGTPIYIDAHSSQRARGEELADTAKVLSLYCDFIAVRINSHDSLLTMADNASIPVINALTSLEHPTQALADCYTILKKKGDLGKLKIAFIGDVAQNTTNSLMMTAVKLGASISLVGPKECKPNALYFNRSREYGEVSVHDSISEGLSGADVIYTDTFVSMGDEADAAARRKMFAPYQLNKEALSYAKGDAVVMHPLPAHRGEEITADVIDGKRSIVWDQAANKLLLEKAVLLYLSG
ncbi:MAG: ornithine carbamoyltransferase [Candidatus Micrarchaeaceae archaeon]